MMRLIALLVVMIDGFTAQTANPFDFDRAWPAVVAKLEQGSITGQDASIREARADCLRALDGRTKLSQPALVRYAVAYANWRLVYLPTVPEEERGPLLDEAVTQLRHAIALNDRNAEAHALLGSVYGSQIGFSPMKGILLGPKASGETERAAQLEPNNPRVLLVQGVSAYNTPAMFGGSVEKAETLLKKALASFETEPPDRPWPNWGRVDAHAWLGQALAKRGDRAGAKSEYEKALALAPDHGWIRYVLMPELEKRGK